MRMVMKTDLSFQVIYVTVSIRPEEGPVMVQLKGQWSEFECERKQYIGIWNTRRNRMYMYRIGVSSLQKIDYLLSMITKEDFTPWDIMNMVTITYQ